jgi:hypothetical protein
MARTVILVGSALLAASCGSGHASATPSPSQASVSVPPPATTAPATPSSSAPGPTPTTRRAVPLSGRCGVADLSAQVRLAGPAAGHRYAILRLTNTSDRDCDVYGYAGMRLLGSGGKALPTSVVRETSPPPKTVALHPRASAWAMLHWSVVPADGEPAHGECEPAPLNAWVTPPDDTAHLTMAWSLGAVCASGTIWTTAFASGTGP